MKSRKLLHLTLVLLFMAFLLAACGGSDSAPVVPADGTQPPADGTQPPADGTQPPADGTQPPADGTQPPADGTQPPADTTPPPADVPSISGFDFSFAEGDFFEFGWDYYKDSWSMSSHTITEKSGTFGIMLGAPVSISGTTAYPITIKGISKPTSTDDFAPRWKFLAISGSKVLGSVDGVSLQVIFDAQNGSWAGGGFFAAFPLDTLITATSGTVTNNYISTSAIKAGRSTSLSQCEVIAGITICGDASYNITEYEYYLAGIGPIGYEYYHTFSDCGGGFCSGATWDHKVGLIGTSLRGDTPTYELEVEPNDASINAQPINTSVDVFGDVHSIDAGSVDRAGMKTEDWYKFTLYAPATVTISLDFTGSDANTDLDLYLYGGRVATLLDSSLDDNAATGIQTETITYAFPAGTYQLGVQAWNTPVRVEYSLSVQ